MANLYDNQIDEMIARYGTFDITGTDAVTDKMFYGFVASEGAVLAVIKGVPIKNAASSAAEVTAAEVDIESFFLTTLTDPLFGSIIYRADVYVITNIQLTSGSLHCIKTSKQPTA